MGGTEDLLVDLISDSNRCSSCGSHHSSFDVLRVSPARSNPAFLLNAFTCLRLPKGVRTKVRPAHCAKQTLGLSAPARAQIGTVMRKSRSRSQLYAVLLAGNRVVHLVQSKEHAFNNSDLLLLINFLTNSESLRSSGARSGRIVHWRSVADADPPTRAESWTPICLPNFNDKVRVKHAALCAPQAALCLPCLFAVAPSLPQTQGYLYAYVCYLDRDLCLTLITSNSEEFFELKEMKDQIVVGQSPLQPSRAHALELAALVDS
jgi:hypothetical protein